MSIIMKCVVLNSKYLITREQFVLTVTQIGKKKKRGVKNEFFNFATYSGNIIKT